MIVLLNKYYKNFIYMVDRRVEIYNLILWLAFNLKM